MTLHLGQPQRKRLRPSETAISSFAWEELVYLYRNRPASAVSTQCREPGRLLFSNFKALRGDKVLFPPETGRVPCRGVKESPGSDNPW